MSIFNELEESKKGLELACLELSRSYDALIGNSTGDDLISKFVEAGYFNKCFLARRIATMDYAEVKKRIMDLSSITFEEASEVFPQLVDLSNYEVRVISFNSNEYLALCPMNLGNIDESEEEVIILGKKYTEDPEVFNLYFPSFFNKGHLDNFRAYNVDSELVFNLIKFVDEYIEYKNDGKVNSWKEFFERYYAYGQLSPYDMAEIEDVEFKHDLDAERNAKRRRADYYAKIQQEETYLIRKRRKSDKNLLTNKYRKANEREKQTNE